MSKLNSILLKKIRGASNELLIEFDKRLDFSVIFGENGSGKSSIVDAFDFICNESIGSLEDKSLGKNRKANYSMTIGCEVNDLEVKLNYDNKEWTSKFMTGLVPNTTGPVGRPVAKILRREKLLEFITKMPSERYQAIKSFIETPKCDKLYSLINSLKKAKKKEYDESVRSYNQAESALKKSWEDEGKKESDFLTWAKKEVSEDIKSLESKNNDIKSIVRSCNSLNEFFEKIEKEKSDYDKLNLNLESKKTEIKKIIEGESGQNSSELIKVLESANDFFEKNTIISNCPVCEQIITQTQVKEQVKERLKSLDKIVMVTKDIDKDEREFNELGVVLKRYQKDFISEIFNIYKILSNSVLNEVKSLSLDCSEYSIFEKDIVISKEIYELSTKFYKYINPIVDFSSMENLNSKRINSYNFIKSQLDIVESSRKNAQDLEKLNERIDRLNNIVVETRNLYIENLLKSIESDIDSMYQKIHPNEHLGKLKLKTDPDKKGSLDISATFCSKNDILPQAYYSESHLDTLGICIFVGLAKLFNSENTVLILDDIVTSSDQVHLPRFLKMLQDEIVNFEHTIVTTHYQIWRDKYRFGSGNVQLIELMDWSIERGIRPAKTKMNIDELKDYRNIEPIDKQIVASKAGIFLELILDNLALLYGCKLARKYQRDYTLGEYLSCFSSRLKKVMRIEVTDGKDVIEIIELKDILNILPEDSPIRNKVGCHFVEIGANYSKEDIKSMADNTIILSEALICNNCGELPFRNKSGSYYECKCNKKRLYPLEEPD